MNSKILTSATEYSLHLLEKFCQVKFTVALLATIAVVSPLYAFRIPATGSGALAKELQDFFDVVPLNEIAVVTRTYLAQDKQFQAMLKLVQSKEGRLFIQDVEAAPVFKKLVNYMQENGLDIYYLINKLNESLNLPHLQPITAAKITGGVLGYLVDVDKLIPMEKMFEIYEDKVEHSEKFNDYTKTFLSDENVEFYLSLSKNVHFQNIENSATQLGVEKDYFQQSYLFFVVISGAVGRQ